MNKDRFVSLLIYFGICSLGIIAIAKILSSVLVVALTPFYPIPISKYLLPLFWNSEKPYEIAQYCITTAILFVYSVACYLLFRNPKVQRRIDEFESTSSRNKIIRLLVGSVILNGALLAIALFGKDGKESLGIFFALALIWPLSFLSPIVKPASNVSDPEQSRFWNRLCLVMIVILCLDFAVMIFPFLFSSIHLMNEFMDVPSESRLINAAGKNGRTANGIVEMVDDQQFISNHGLIHPIGEEAGNFIEIKPSRWLSEFCEKDDKVVYDDISNRLYILEPLSQDELRCIVDAVEDPHEKTNVQHAELAIETYWNEEGRRLYTDDEREFIKENRFEIHWKYLNRWVLHHHNFMLAPMNDHLLGRNSSESYFQYGYLSNIILEKTCVLLTGDIAYQTYIPIYYSFYLIYFALSMWTAWVFFRSYAHVAIVALVTVFALGVVGYKLTLLGPGMNPMRHLLDLPTAWCLFNCFRSKISHYRWYVVAHFLSLIQIGLSREFGAFLALSVLICYLLHLINLRANIWKILVTFVCSILTISMALIIFNVGVSGESNYYLHGLLGFESGQRLLIPLGIASGIYFLICFLLLSNEESNVDALMSIFLGMYVLQLDTYYVWNHLIDHLMSVLALHSFALLFLWSGWRKKYPFGLHYEKWTILLALSGIIFLVMGSTIKYYFEEYSYLRIFSTHKVYSWEFPRLKAVSTMDPTPFVSSVDIINRHRENRNGIWIISRYDMILPYLSRTYSMMPFFEIGNFMVTTKEKAVVLSAIETARPNMIFVDTDMMKNFRMDIVPSSNALFGYLHMESVSRADRLSMIQDLWQQIHDDYRLIESGPMISAWERKN